MSDDEVLKWREAVKTIIRSSTSSQDVPGPRITAPTPKVAANVLIYWITWIVKYGGVKGKFDEAFRKEVRTWKLKNPDDICCTFAPLTSLLLSPHKTYM